MNEQEKNLEKRIDNLEKRVDELIEHRLNQMPVQVWCDENEVPCGVLVQTLDESFVVELHDLDGKSDFSFDTANERLKELGKTTFNRKQALILLAYIEEVNAALVEAGGEPIAKNWYTTSELYKSVGRADYDAGYSWCFYGYNGYFSYDYRYYRFFRCRPVLDYNQA